MLDSDFKKSIKLNKSDLCLLKSLINMIDRPIYIYTYIIFLGTNTYVSLHSTEHTV